MPQETESFIVEIGDKPVGVLVREASGFSFHAASAEAWPLDRRIFPSVRAATREAERLLRRK